MVKNYSIMRSRLESEQKRLNTELEQFQVQMSPDGDRRDGSPFGKREEEAMESAELEKRMTLQQRILDQLVEIDHALDKLEKGTYGFCDHCGEAIDPARLEALPQASLCLKCKAELKDAKG
ncbi:MAG: TraR/DksA C4-type zinc finger protein [Dehalococcoidales bacterium]|jgi:RNA polymerase-binding protein DksA